MAIYEGWTIPISTDTPSGTGDHENYFSQPAIYRTNGDKYKADDCLIESVRYRQKEVHKYWTEIDNHFIFSIPTSSKRIYSYQMNKNGGSVAMNPFFIKIKYKFK